MVKKALKAVNGVLAPLGIEITRRGKASGFEMGALLDRVGERRLGIKTVIDIGASDGKWSEMAMKPLSEAKFLAIEPLKEREQELAALKAREPRFDFALCVAGGEDGGTATLNVTPDLDGSTVGATTGGTARQVPIRSVDGLIAEKILQAPYLLKFDTHGFEMPILEGCKATLPNTMMIVMEVYNFEMVPGTLTFPEMCAYLAKEGFRPMDLADPMLRMKDKALWQMDLAFLRADHDLFRYTQYQ